MRSCEFALWDSENILTEQIAREAQLSPDMVRPHVEKIVALLSDNGVVLCALEGNQMFQAAISGHRPAPAKDKFKTAELMPGDAAGMLTMHCSQQTNLPAEQLRPKVEAVIINLYKQGLRFCVVEGYDLYDPAIAALMKAAAA